MVSAMQTTAVYISVSKFDTAHKEGAYWLEGLKFTLSFLGTNKLCLKTTNSIVVGYCHNDAHLGTQQEDSIY